jgi:uncharacterized glyoxalase superfamily metalloenzyme YdcJ
MSARALSREPIDEVWNDELTAVSPVAADIAGVNRTPINHLSPRVLDIDELNRRMTAHGVTMIDAIHGPPRSGVALTRKGRERYDAAMAAPGPAAALATHFPATHVDMAAADLAYHRGADSTKSLVYEDFPSDSAGGILRSNLTGGAAAVDVDDVSDDSFDRLAATIGHHVHDPYDLYEKAAS